MTSRVRDWIKEHTDKHFCNCGCGEHVKPNRDRYYKWLENPDRSWFINYHQNRRENHPNYKGGERITEGYYWILRPDHPRANKRNYVKRAWLEMEKKLGRPVYPWEIVHHKNGDKLDDRPENLEIVSRKRHGKMHNGGKGNPAYRYDIDAETDIIPLVKRGLTRKKIVEELGCSTATVDKRIRNYRKSHEGERVGV